MSIHIHEEQNNASQNPLHIKIKEEE